MTECVFCGNSIEDGIGFTLFKRDGTPRHYCSRKCKRNEELKRKPRDTKWSKHYKSQ